MQDNHPICYISRALGPRHQSLSVYEKELLAVVHAVQAWSSYLTHRPFLIRTDQKSLKYLLEQKVSTPFQHLWLSKLMGYTFEIHYKQGKENVAADALSRVTGSQLLAISISHACPDLFDKIQLLWQSDANLKKLISDLQADLALHPSYSYSNNKLRHRNKLVVGNDPAIKTSIFHTPYEILYGQPPPLHLPYLPGESSSAVVDRSLRKREELLELLKFHLHCAQNRQKQAADARRSAREFQVGDHIYLKLQPYRQQSLKNRNIPHKLSPRFYGPFLVTDRVGSVAYKLQLPATAAIHNVFHISQLKLCPNPSSSASDLPQFLLDVGTAKEPEAILERKMVNRQNRAATKVLVHWKGETPDMATWEFYADFIAKYPAFHP
ncbi:hypothetical protein V2J09_010832 [Rumex salicifolius]